MQQLFRPSRLAMLVALAAVPAWAQAAYPAYKSGTAYKAGDIVSNVGVLYECKEFPYSGCAGHLPITMNRALVRSGRCWRLYGGEVHPQALACCQLTGCRCQFNEGASVALAVSLSGPVTALVKVEFLVDGKQVVTASASPWNASWSAAGVGAHALKARALDKDGKV